MAIAILVFSFLWSFPNRNQSLMSLLERLSFDVQMEMMRKFYPRQAKVEPVLIGMDEASEDIFEEPLAMWHEHLGKTMRALAASTGSDLPAVGVGDLCWSGVFPWRGMGPG